VNRDSIPRYPKRRLRKAKAISGYTAAFCAAAFLSALVGGASEAVLAVALIATFGFLVSWWWFDHSLDVHRIAEELEKRP
jgi:hypothetical protein